MPRFASVLFAAGVIFLSAAAPSFAATAEGIESEDQLFAEFLWEELKELPAGRRPEIGLVLSGGGARAVAHVGVIKILEREGFPVDLVTGTSMGALLGALYAAETPFATLDAFARNMQISSGVDLNALSVLRLIISDRLLSTKKIETLVNQYIGDTTFDALKKPFACVAMDIKTGERIVFRSGPVAPAVRASVNVPGLFEPVLYRHRLLVDGGVVDYVPAKLAGEMGADWVLASVTEGDFTRSTLPNVLMTLEQVIDIGGSLLVKEALQYANFVITPKVGDMRNYEFGRAHGTVDLGIQAANASIEPAKRNLLRFSMPFLMKKWSAR
ncbi:MAG: patatin-like phospholipase family protein [Elusimicrobia bacterium]|nr:patatin-like phospholipase family protein [Elusimicrobiota bacterium]